MIIAKRFLGMAVLGLSLAIVATSCKGPAESAGAKVDKAVQNTKDSVHDAAKDMKQ